MRAITSLPPTLRSALLAVRRRRRLQAAVVLATALGGALLLALGLAALAPGALWARALAWALLVFSIALPGAWALLPTLRRTARLLDVARFVDERSPDLGGALAAAVDLAATPPTDERGAALAALHIRRADELSAAVDPAALLPWPVPLRRAAQGLALCLLAAAALHPDLVGSGLPALLWGAAPRTAEVPVAAEEIATLDLRNLRLELEPPAYSGREPLVLDGASGELQVLPGTRVRLSADLSASGEGARAVGPELDRPLQVEGASLSGDFEARGAWWQVKLQRSLGREDLQTRRFRIELLPDRAPRLELDAPAGEVELQPGGELPLFVRASDDFGLSRLEWSLSQRGRELQRGTLVDPAGVRSWEGDSTWLLPEGSEGELELVIEAWDNDTVSGPKVTRASAVSLYVPTPRDQHRRVFALKQALLDASVDLLADLLVDSHERQPGPGDRATVHRRDELVAEHTTHQRGVERLVEAGAQLSEAMLDDPLADASAWVGIGQAVENLLRRWSDVQEFAERKLIGTDGAFVHPVVVKDLLALQAPVVSELERVVLDLSAYLDQHGGREARARLASVDEQLAQLDDLVQRARQGDDIDAELQSSLQELAQQLQALGQELARRAPRPDEGFANKVPPDLSGDTLSDIARLLAEGRHDEAAEAIRRAMEAVAEMSEALEQQDGALAGDQQAAELMQQMARARADLDELTRKQERLQRDTEGLGQRFDDREADPAPRLAKLLAELRQQIEALQPLVAQGRPRQLVGDRLQRAEANRVDLASAVRDGDLDRAMIQGLDVERELSDAARRLRLLSARSRVAEAQGGEPPGVAAARVIDAAEGAARAAAAVVEELQRMLQDQDRQRQQAAGASEGLAQRQEALGHELQALRDQMEQLGGSAFNPVEGRQGVERAGEFMEGAQQHLGRGRPGAAAQAQGDAVRELQQAGRSLDQAQQNLQQGGAGAMQMARRPGPGGHSGQSWDDLDSLRADETSGDVALPRPEDFVTPDDFRRLVQEGVAGDVPERYRPLKRSYYEELVR